MTHLYGIIGGSVRLTDAGRDTAYDAARQVSGVTAAVLDAIAAQIAPGYSGLADLIETSPRYRPTFDRSRHGDMASTLGRAWAGATEALGMDRQAIGWQPPSIEDLMRCVAADLNTLAAHLATVEMRVDALAGHRGAA